MITREELYELVWSQPMQRLGERLGVSVSYLARVCSTLNVPRPERGYWAKLAVGKAPPVRPLPEALPGDALCWTTEGALQNLRPRPRPAAPGPRVGTRPVRIPRGRVHRLVGEARQHFARGYRVDDGALLRPYKQLMADVTTSRGCLDRSLALASDLYNALESVGHRVVLSAADANLYRDHFDEREQDGSPRPRWERATCWSPGRPTVVLVGSVAIGLAIIEMTENVEVRYVDGRWIRAGSSSQGPRALGPSWTSRRDLPSGRLRIVAYAPYGRIAWSMRWQEAGSSTLRSRLRDIVEEVERAAPVLVDMLAEAERRAEEERLARAAEDERRAREEDRRRIEQSIVDSRTELAEVIARWTEAVGVEAFLDGVERRAASLEDGDRAGIVERLRLAREFVGGADPFEFLRNWRMPRERYSPRF